VPHDEKPKHDAEPGGLDASSPTLTEGPEAATEGFGAGDFVLAVGKNLGGRYQVVGRLGAGGMGEVWCAFDLKLRVEVALKALREGLFKDEKGLEMLRQEVRSAREVVSPNVCRIFDLVEADGRELVSMEYVDGQTLLAVLQESGPLELKEAQDIASQFLAGLEAIHRAGLVHRDVKPENIMLTRAGRVVLMDFGLVRGEDSGAGTVAGTPAYMAPEQAAGLKVDARADVYSAGVVLAEMVSPEGIKSLESRKSLWEGVRSEPARLPDSPWAPVLKKAVAKEPEQRYNSAHTLTRALEDVTLRVEGAEDLRPYPGLASFTEEDAEYFFGREAEVETSWRRLEGAHLLAIVGPSGAGKTSFIAAGLVPNAPVDWAIVRCTPGNTAISSLARVMAREMAGDADAMELAVGFDDLDAAVELFSLWRRRQDHALLVVDQFEELFTLNSQDEQARFAELIGRLALEADVRVLLSMRDDFLMECRGHDALVPVFGSLTPLMPPTGPALRRAVVQPATKCGYRFEDEGLVEEMLAEVEGERGALPLLAFAMARLWEKRDRQNGLLSREAFHDIGGVGGALARHAEETIDCIGLDRVPVVRELFRNLVTAEGTRAVRGWDELLSVFQDSQRGLPEEVLRELIDARLLTSYEVQEEDREPTRRVEIIHESLLAAWPRLVRWQTQDADAAQLRDQLRQAAKTWDEHDRPTDLLWTGTAYREYAVWRERFPGGLTGLEEQFVHAMTTHAKRRRRRRGLAVAAAFVALLAVLAVVGMSRQQALAEANRAEAAKLLAIGQTRLDEDPTEALAFTTASLELADTEEARIFALRTLWAGPPALMLDLLGPGLSDRFAVPTFSPDGRWLALGGLVHDQVLVWSEGGGQPTVLGGHSTSTNSAIPCGWSRDGLLVTGHFTEGRVRVWTMPEGKLVREIDLGGNAVWQVGESHLFAEVFDTGPDTDTQIHHLRSWELRDGEPIELGEIDREELGLGDLASRVRGASYSAYDPTGKSWLYSSGNRVFSRPLPVGLVPTDILITRHSSPDAWITHWRRPEGLYSSDSGGEVTLWTLADDALTPGRLLRTPENVDVRLLPDPSGRWAVEKPLARDGRVLLWDLDGLGAARPWPLRRSGSWYYSHVDFHPRNRWVVATTNDLTEVTFWPLPTALPVVVGGYDTLAFRPVRFTAHGRHLVTPWGQDRVRLWPWAMEKTSSCSL
jgi:WD40 repeat protein